MKLSLKWLKEFVDLDVSPKEFAEAMTMSGSKVERYEIEGEKLKNVIVGKVTSIEKHPNAERLFVCLVDVGKGENIQIVTGAKNLTVGNLVPVAMDNSILANGTKIKKGKLRGMESNGMMCSLEELGLTHNDFPDALEDGIFVLQTEAKLGQDIREAIGLNDVKFEFEITSNRPDCLSVIGLAREAAATFKKELKLKEPVFEDVHPGAPAKIKVNVKEEELCPAYCAAVLKNVRVEPSPQWIQTRLTSIGVRPINNIVDITNYVMLEHGQPMHAFDLEFLQGREINIRRAKLGEKITTLDGVERALTEDNLVIADAVKPVAIAGVIGGELSGIHTGTQSIVLESANFSACSLRKTAKQFALRTESSARFEKGLSPENCLHALHRALELIALLGAGTVDGPPVVKKQQTNSETRIEFLPDWINAFLGTDIPAGKMKEILERLDCKVAENDVIVPFFRQDLKEKADIAEEIARFYGYNNVSSDFLPKTIGGFYSRRQKFDTKVADTLCALGLNEICTIPFCSQKDYDKISLSADNPLRNSIKILNPLGKDTNMMRTTTLPSLLAILSQNYKNKNENARLFEIAKVYIPNEQNQLPHEKHQLIAGFYGESIDFFAIKGILEELLESFGLKCKYKAEVLESYHPGRCAGIYIKGEKIGTLAEVHPVVCENYGIDDRVYVFALDIDAMWQNAVLEKTYKELPKFPAVKRDLALVCEEDLPAAELLNLIENQVGSLLENIELFDVYQGDQIAKGKKSLAFRISLRSGQATLQDDEIQKVIQKILKKVGKIGVVLRE